MMAECPDNFVPLPYRRVSFQQWEMPLTPEPVKRILLGRDAYRRTEFLVLRNGERTAVVQVDTEDREPLFSPIRSVEWIAGPEECRFVEDPTVDVGIPTALAEKARTMGVSPTETLIVLGKYSHVNFIHHPRPLTIQIFDVIPPEPSKLHDLVRRVLEYAKLPPTRIEVEIVDLRDRARGHESPHYLFPCRASGINSLGRPVSFLDERPTERDDWVLVGCQRTRAIYDHFYSGDVATIEMCPRELHGPVATPLLIRCCQLEEGFQREGLLAQVPWGAELQDVEDALQSLHVAAREREASALDT